MGDQIVCLKNNRRLGVCNGTRATIHKTQGAIVDRGLVLGTDELFRERGYVALSRGRSSNYFYLLGTAEIDDSTGHGPPPMAFWPIEDLVTEKQRLRDRIGQMSLGSTDSRPSSTQPRKG